ncbi:STAS domain-containing protein [Streptomyces sp. NBC_01275]|uniref:STAS domain-containing protein n=1 Tax=Streptomyces sp. NBC_01275 TaxID=2903807 RepID=UPI00224F6EF1|nr:STAS domain-containing protein [Streptomyces sp. NBC_01275]MCX4761904.1 STAS domain-containing protein [Streptomyces sp. NBC_01275]
MENDEPPQQGTSFSPQTPTRDWLPAIGQSRTLDDGTMMGPSGSVHIHRRGGWTILDVRGDVDPEFLKLRDTALILIERDEPEKLILDASSAPPLNSIALGILVGILKRSRSKDIEFRMVTHREDYLKVFQITGLIHIFPLYAKMDDAISGLNPIGRQP